MEAGNNFKKKPDGSGRLSRSGFRFNIARNCRWSADDAKRLPQFRAGYAAIDWSKDSRNQTQTGE